MADDSPRTPEGGVLGNLPHSRPGRRSEKRGAGRPAEAAGAAAEKAETADAAAARTPAPKRPARAPKRASRPRKPAATRARSAAPPPPEPPPAAPSRGPVEDAVHAAGKIAAAGMRVAGGLTKGILRRLPRP